MTKTLLNYIQNLGYTKSSQLSFTYNSEYVFYKVNEKHKINFFLEVFESKDPKVLSFDLRTISFSSREPKLTIEFESFLDEKKIPEIENKIIKMLIAISDNNLGSGLVHGYINS